MGIKRKIKKNKTADSIYLWEAFEEFVQEKEAKNLSYDTLRNYRQSFKMFAEFHEFTDQTVVEEVFIGHFYKWINTMKLEGVKPSSINHYLRDCRTFFYWCMDPARGYINPPYKIVMVEGQEEPLKMFSDDEIALLLEKPKRNASFVEWRTWAIVNWILGTGNRSATLVEVRMNDINYNRKEITLQHTKNKKAQVIPLSSSLEVVLKEYCRMWRKDADVNAYLFCNVGEWQLTTNSLRHSFARYCEDRGVSKTNIHGLRHNFAKGWVQNNGNMFALQKILGHSSLEMTRKYVKLFSEDIKEDFDRFSPLDSIKRKSKRTQIVKRS